MSGADFLVHLIAGWLIADLLSGVLHWLEDGVLWQSMPILGPHVVRPNRVHHVDPMAFTHTPFFARNSTTWLPALAIAAAWLWLCGFSIVWLGALAGGLLANEVHVRTHRQGNGAWYLVLQEIGIVQSRRQHAQHHRGAMDGRYCVLTDWLNPILDALGVWASIEAAMTAIGLAPNRGTK